jgi:hypothetical protein
MSFRALIRIEACYITESCQEKSDRLVMGSVFRYSVAWYPIYRIPDGNFRTAFLTYHSLGHLVHRSAKFDSPSKNECVVSPVVGLQSYNAQVVINTILVQTSLHYSDSVIMQVNFTELIAEVCMLRCLAVSSLFLHMQLPSPPMLK